MSGTSAPGEAQFRQVRDLVRLATGGLEEDRRSHPAMDVAQRTLRVGVQRPGVRLLSGDVRIDGRDELGLAQLAQDRAPESHVMKGRGTKGNQRLPPRRRGPLAIRPRDPLRQHCQRARAKHG